MGGNAQKGLGEQGPIMYRRGKLGNKSRWVEIGSQIVEGSKHNYNKGYSIKNYRVWGPKGLAVSRTVGGGAIGLK